MVFADNDRCKDSDLRILQFGRPSIGRLRFGVRPRTPAIIANAIPFIETFNDLCLEAARAWFVKDGRRDIVWPELLAGEGVGQIVVVDIALLVSFIAH